MLVGVPPSGVRQGQPAHGARRVAIGARPEDEVGVVGHDTVRQRPHVIARDGLGQGAGERPVIAPVVEDGKATVGAVQRVVDESALGGAGRSAHGDEAPGRVANVNFGS
jgi:hypothetical protein